MRLLTRAVPVDNNKILYNSVYIVDWVTIYNYFIAVWGIVETIAPSCRGQTDVQLLGPKAEAIVHRVLLGPKAECIWLPEAQRDNVFDFFAKKSMK